MPNNDKNVMSLKTVPFQFAEFKPIEYKPVEIDTNILNRSMEKIESRRNQAYQELDSFKRITAPLRDKLNTAEYAAFDANVEAQENAINTEIQNGNYGKAWILASQFGGSLVKDNHIQNAIKIEEQRNKRLDEINKGKYDDLTKLRFKETNPYLYNDNGTYEDNWTPVTDIPLENIFQQATSTTPTRQSSNSNSKTWNENSFKDKDGNVTKEPGKTVTETKTTNITEGGSKTVTSLTTKDQLNSLDALLSANPQYDLAMRQNFENNMWALNYYRNKLQNAETEEEKQFILGKINEYESNLKDENGIIPTSLDTAHYKSWRDKKALKYFNSKSYTHIATSTNSSNTTSFGLSSTSKGNGNGNDDSENGVKLPIVTGLGAGVEAKIDATNVTDYGQIAEGAAQAIN